MAGNIKGITIEFDADGTKFTKKLRDMESSISKLDKELKQVNTALKFNPTSVDLWRQKHDLLNQKITETKDKLDTLKRQQQAMNDAGVDKNSEQYRTLQREIITTQSKLKTFETQLRAIGNVNLRALSEQFKQIGDKVTSMGTSMTQKFTGPIVAGYTAAAKYASDYEENLNKIDVAFGQNSAAVKEWANNAGESFGLSKVQATDAVSAFGALGKGIGLSEQEAAGMSTTLAGLSADLGSYFNVGIDESSKALEGIFTGESEALKKFGVVMTDTNLKQFAADQGLVYTEMSEAEKVALRYQYVLEKTSDAQGDFSRTGDGTANSLKTFQASLQDLATSIGTNLLPIITPIVQKITEWVNKFNELSPSTQKVITIIGLIVAVLGPVLIVIGTLISSVGSIIGLIGVVGPLIGNLAVPILIAIGVITLLVAAGTALYQNWDVIKAKAEELWAKITEVWNGIVTSVTQIITQLVSAVVARLSALRTQIMSIWTNIKTTVSNLATGLKDAVTGTYDKLKSKVTGATDTIKSKLSSAWSSLKSTASSVWEGIKNAMTSPIETARDTLLGIVDAIKSKFPIKLGNIFNFKTPSISIGSKTVEVGDKKVTVPTFNVSWHKLGGIFTKATLLAGADGRLHGVGEAGPEAILPLNELWKHMAEMNQGVTINVYASQGMDVNELAVKIEQRLILLQKQRAKAYGTI